MRERIAERAGASFRRTLRALRHRALTAGLLTLALALLTTRGLESADAAVHLDMALAMATRGETSLSIDPGELWVPSRPIAGGLFHQGEDGLHSASAPGLALLAVPLVGAASAIAREPLRLDPLFAGGPPRAVLRPLQADPRVIAFSLIGPLAAALAVCFFVLAAHELALSPRAIALATAALVLGSPLLAYAGTAWTQLPTCAGLSFILWRACAREARSGASAWPLGIASAAVLLVRPDHLPFIVLIGVALYRIERGWRRAPTRAMARFLVPIALALGILALFGLPESGDGWSLARLPSGALGLLASPSAGLALFAPFVLLAPFARLPSRIAALLIGWLACALGVYGGWFDWPASLAYGPRFLVPILPALAIALAAALERPALRVMAVIAIALGLAVNLPGALLVHARIDEPASPLDAWRALLGGGEVGALGVDCASTYVLAYPLMALVIASIGMVLQTRRR